MANYCLLSDSSRDPGRITSPRHPANFPRCYIVRSGKQYRWIGKTGKTSRMIESVQDVRVDRTSDSDRSYCGSIADVNVP